MEVESEESNVELDMEGVIGEYQIEMMDLSCTIFYYRFQETIILMKLTRWETRTCSKEMTDQEMESFDEKRSEAMQAFSEMISRSK